MTNEPRTTEQAEALRDASALRDQLRPIIAEYDREIRSGYSPTAPRMRVLLARIDALQALEDQCLAIAYPDSDSFF